MNLADFDPDVVVQYHITHLELERVVRYVRLLQGPIAPTLDDIAVGGYYGTAALLHEVVELRLLLARDPELLGRDRETIQRFWRANEDAHAEALIEEYQYLRGKVAQLFAADVPLGALVVANTNRDDFNLLLESNIPVRIFEPSKSEVMQAAHWLEQVRQMGKEMLL
jgi:hypothetical protein